MRPTIAAPAKPRRRLTLFRPAYALLAFGALTAGSTWLWFGQGLFIPRLAGLLLMGGLGLSAAGAAVALLRRRRPLVALALFLAMAVALPLLILVAYRMKTGVPILMHDGAYQTEEAIRFVLSGQNPYGRDYSRTSMRLWHWYVNTPLDPSLFHYVYYPATFLLPLPFAALSFALHLPFDVRLVWLGAIGVGGWALWAMPWRWEWRYVALCALFLDPLFYFPQGRNDILWLAGITLGLLAFSRGRLRLAALAFGAALAFKPFAVFFAILIAVAIVRRCGGRRPLRTAGILAGLAVPAALTIGPFFLWNPAAFWADTVAFVAGTDPHS
ncbi:MAG TPA: hypothetical protein VET65_06570, partial [Candidatus Limnocylindrales bacterium]|nr:hypothetical protein [Candidatus Limnocylindrales bacterium]